MTILPEQVAAGEAVLKPYVTDPNVSLGGLVLQIVNAFLDAGLPRKKSQKPEDEPEGFDAFYSSFPRRIGRRTASLAYGRALKRSTPEIILAGCKRYADSVRGTEQQYIKHPATWLNADGWKDELGQLSLVPVAIEETSVDGWVKRLEIFAGRSDSPKGSWRASWGPKPKELGCKVPEAAKKRYLEIYPPKAANGG